MEYVPDLGFYIHLENVPHTNSHFRNNLASFKVPITSGYQSIEYNADNAKFAQYIENTDINYILDKIKLKVYDRNNNLLINGFDWTFTLGVEHYYNNISSISNTIQFYHFDTTQKDNLVDDPFQCQFTLTNPLRRVKKIYLKSCEMPIGFFNIREPITFSFLRSTNDFRDSLSFLSENRISIYSYTDSAINNYNSTSTSGSSTIRDVNGVDISSFYTSPNPDLQLSILNSSNSDYKIYTVNIPAGNYTIFSLITYINNGIKAIFNKFILTKGPEPNYLYPNLTLTTINKEFFQ